MIGNSESKAKKRKREDYEAVNDIPAENIPSAKRTKVVFTQASKAEIAEQNPNNLPHHRRNQVYLREYFDNKNGVSIPELFKKAKLLAEDLKQGKTMLIKRGCNKGHLVLMLCGFILNHDLGSAKDFMRKIHKRHQFLILDTAVMSIARHEAFYEIYLATLIHSDWKVVVTKNAENILHLAARKNDGGLTAICILNLLDQESKERMLSSKSKSAQSTPLLEAAINGDLETFEAIALNMPDWKETQLAQIVSTLNSLGRVDKIKDLNRKFNLGGTVAVVSTGRPLVYFQSLSPACILSKSSNAIMQRANEARKANGNSFGHEATQGLSRSI